jgi:hypothetical protein
MCFYVKSNYEATFRWSVINAFCLLPLFIDGITFDRVSSNRQFGSAKVQTIFMLSGMQSSIVLAHMQERCRFFLKYPFLRIQFAYMCDVTFVCHCIGLFILFCYVRL